MTTLSRAPIYTHLGGRKRELRFNLNSAILLKDAGFDAKPITTKEGEDDKGAHYRVDLACLRAHLWAALQFDAGKHGEELTIEAAGELLEANDDIVPVTADVQKALLRFFGQEVDAPGEAAAPRRGKKAGRSKSGSVSSAAR